MPVDYTNCDYLSPDNKKNEKHANAWSDFQNGQIQYICNQVMIKGNGQYQQFHRTINKIWLEEISILLPTLEQTIRNKKGILGFILK